MFKLNKQVPIENLISRQVSFWETSNKTSVAKKAGLFFCKQFTSQATTIRELFFFFGNYRYKGFYAAALY